MTQEDATQAQSAPTEDPPVESGSVPAESAPCSVPAGRPWFDCGTGASLPGYENQRDEYLARTGAKVVGPTSKQRTSPLGSAIRQEIRKLLEAEVLMFDALASIVRLAEGGQSLLAVRNPMAGFDAQPTNWNDGPMPNPYAYGDDYPHWDGSAIRGAKEARQKEIRAALKDSPLADALKRELLELTDLEPFGVTELLQIQQIAEHGDRMLRAALGIDEESPGDTGTRLTSCRKVRNASPPFSSPFSSSETFGAQVIREIVAKTNNASGGSGSDPEKLVAALATARERGLDDVATKLEEQLGLGTQPKVAKPKEG